MISFENLKLVQIHYKKRQISDYPKQSEISRYSSILTEFRLFSGSQIRMIGNSF